MTKESIDAFFEAWRKSDIRKSPGAFKVIFIRELLWLLDERVAHKAFKRSRAILARDSRPGGKFEKFSQKVELAWARQKEKERGSAATPAVAGAPLRATPEREN